MRHIKKRRRAGEVDMENPIKDLIVRVSRWSPAKRLMLGAVGVLLLLFFFDIATNPAYRTILKGGSINKMLQPPYSFVRGSGGEMREDAFHEHSGGGRSDGSPRRAAAFCGGFCRHHAQQLERGHFSI